MPWCKFKRRDYIFLIFRVPDTIVRGSYGSYKMLEQVSTVFLQVFTVYNSCDETKTDRATIFSFFLSLDKIWWGAMVNFTSYYAIKHLNSSILKTAARSTICKVYIFLAKTYQRMRIFNYKSDMPMHNKDIKL